ncbi:MAG: tol-pal system-associated acyl-CoA thioesterase [Magnetococcales bacterium]|nr:tol-pal system-associated acyl-CoA thioesterase [Magnetococcales bacterium]
MQTSPSFSWPIQVYYEDTDAGGVVYHSKYLNFMERARTEWLRAMGYGQKHLADDSGLVFAVTAMDVKFLAPARLDDKLKVFVALVKTGRASLVLAQKIERESDGMLLISATAKIAMLNDKFKPTRIPTTMLAVLNKQQMSNI